RRMLPLLLAVSVLVSGKLVDPSGAGVPHATVTLKRIATAITDEAGRFSIQAPPGRYRLEVNAGGAFTIARQDITVPAEPLTIRLELAKVAESLDVTADETKPAVDTAANLDATRVSGT